MQNVKELLDKEVTRREFLLHIGTALLAVIGISSLIKNLSQAIPTSQKEQQLSSYGFSGYSGTIKQH